jgi:hypothetical protein
MNYQNSGYDEELGIESEITDYILDSHLIQLRIGGTTCYLLKAKASGAAYPSVNGTVTVASWDETDPNHISYIWDKSSANPKPDLRPYVSSGSGSVSVWIDGSVGNRVYKEEDILANNEFVLRERIDLDSGRIELILKSDFTPTSVEYYYTGIEGMWQEPNANSLNPVEYGTKFGYSQYLCDAHAPYFGTNQLLVRFPLTVQILGWKEYGLEVLKQNHCWTISSPIISNRDVIIIPALTGIPEQRFEVYDKEDSFIRSIYLSQRFKVQLIEYSSIIYSIPIITT